MVRARIFLLLSLATASLSLSAVDSAIPSPEQFLGHRIGAEKKLVRWDKILDYMQLVAKGSDRVLLQDVGKTTNNNRFILLIISSPANLKSLDRYKQINRTLFDPRTIGSDGEAKMLAREGRLFLLISCGIHANEVGATQMSLELVHRLATDNSPEIRTVLDNVIFLLAPSLNPDGQILVTDWYNKNLGTPYENAPLPWLYHPYTGHDNNRDAYMFTQKETQLIGKLVFKDWLPEVWLDEHQMGVDGPRIFVMPAMDPINPNVDPLIYRNTALLGSAQAAALERAGKEGIIHGELYSYWWEGAMAWAGWWHNMVGLLTEVASARLGTSIEQQKADPNRPGLAATGDEQNSDLGRLLPPPSDVQPRIQYPRPWLGGKWSLRDIVDYELIATFGLLETAAELRTQLLDDLYLIGKRQIDLGKRGDPFAIVVPRDQADRPTVVKMLQTLAYGGIEVHQAEHQFYADGKNYPAGSYVILLAQPFRAYAKDMLEAQVYPTGLRARGAPAVPYDAAGWSLGMQMGVETIFVKNPFEADLKLLDGIALPAGQVVGRGPVYLLSHDPNNSLVAVNRLLRQGYDVSWLSEPASDAGRSYPTGTIVVRGGTNLGNAIADICKSLGIDAATSDSVPSARAIRIHAPRTGLYQPWGGNMDEGWTRWLLEQNEFPFTSVHPENIRSGEVLKGLDVVLFPDMAGEQIIMGLTARDMPDPYRGGIGEAGLKGLRAFAEGGGTIIALGQSSALLMDKFAVPYRDGLRGIRREEFFCPGSIVRVLVDNLHPIAYGLKEEADAYFTNSMVLEPFASFAGMPGSIIVRYPNSGILRSGWLKGENYLHNKVGAAEVKFGKGRLILLPLRVQHRAQTYGTFKLLFNAILTSSVENP